MTPARFLLPLSPNALLNLTARMQLGPSPAFGCAALTVSAASGSVFSTLRAGCHLYLAPTSHGS
jgi:hypothetical protein